VIRHLVLIEWNDDVTEDVVAAFEVGLRELRTVIPSIIEYTFGANLGLPGSTADYVICADFDDLDGYLAYRDDPAHERFRREHLLPNARSRTAAQLEIL
jgi:hypothetical protein